MNAKASRWLERGLEFLVCASVLVTGWALLSPWMNYGSCGGAQTLNNLRYVALSTQAYATEFHGWLPPGGSRDDVLPERSWQTQLLPYLDRGRLYHGIDFTRPWNSPENSELLSLSLPEFYSVEEKDRRLVNGYAVTHFTANSRLLRAREGINLDDLSRKDGTSETILMGEIGSAFPPWARPGNTRDPARGLAGGPEQFGNSRGAPCAIVFAGGNCRNLSPEISPRVLELLADPDNGVPSSDDF